MISILGRRGYVISRRARVWPRLVLSRLLVWPGGRLPRARAGQRNPPALSPVPAFKGFVFPGRRFLALFLRVLTVKARLGWIRWRHGLLVGWNGDVYSLLSCVCARAPLGVGTLLSSWPHGKSRDKGRSIQKNPRLPGDMFGESTVLFSL